MRILITQLLSLIRCADGQISRNVERSSTLNGQFLDFMEYWWRGYQFMHTLQRVEDNLHERKISINIGKDIPLRNVLIHPKKRNSRN